MHALLATVVTYLLRTRIRVVLADTFTAISFLESGLVLRLLQYSLRMALWILSSEQLHEAC
jgi:hypothetical protein